MENKKPSGAANRKRKEQELAQARENERQRSPRKVVAAPVVNDPATALIYAAQCSLQALTEIQADKTLTAEQRWAWTEKFTKAIGMTHSKSVIQNRLKQLEESDEPEHDEELEPNPVFRGATPKG